MVFWESQVVDASKWLMILKPKYTKMTQTIFHFKKYLMSSVHDFQNVVINERKGCLLSTRELSN